VLVLVALVMTCHQRQNARDHQQFDRIKPQNPHGVDLLAHFHRPYGRCEG
jgi:hypothetical protein